MMSAMAIRGSSAATSNTKSAVPRSQIRSRMMVVRSRMTSSMRRTMRGVNPVLTSLRYLVCWGGSVMTIWRPGPRPGAMSFRATPPAPSRPGPVWWENRVPDRWASEMCS